MGKPLGNAACFLTSAQILPFSRGGALDRFGRPWWHDRCFERPYGFRIRNDFSKQPRPAWLPVKWRFSMEASVPNVAADPSTRLLVGISRFGRRAIKGVLLTAWIGVLVFLALWAMSGSASEVLSTTFAPSRNYTPLFGDFAAGSDNCPAPSVLLQSHTALRRNPPPIGAVLDSLAEDWNSVGRPCDSGYIKEVAARYQPLFQRIENRLRSIAEQSSDATPVSIDISILPKDIPPNKNYTTGTKLPPEVTAWIAQEKVRLQENKQRAALFDTVLLLTVIGGFGSIIFLTRDYILLEEHTGIAAYIFRPILGIFLAIAVFTLDILAHAIISSASILEVRYEPLYVLALAAGLLSEQAYAVVRFRAEESLRKYKEPAVGAMAPRIEDRRMSQIME
jgi:hypothetical protein